MVRIALTAAYRSNPKAQRSRMKWATCLASVLTELEGGARAWSGTASNRVTAEGSLGPVPQRLRDRLWRACSWGSRDASRLAVDGIGATGCTRGGRVVTRGRRPSWPLRNRLETGATEAAANQSCPMDALRPRP